MSVESGIAPIGNVEWGTHFCHFYKSAEDLAETLVPFFKTGLEGNEACLWVTAEPFTKEQAWSSLNTNVSGLDRRLRNGQIAIFDHSEWYARYGALNPTDVAEMWTAAAAQASRDGYGGLRLTGNTAFLEPAKWDGFMDYENCLREAFRGQRLIALCSYDSHRCDADAVLDVVQAHDFALARRRGDWEVIESASVKHSKDALVALNTQLESRIAERTRELSDALEHQRLLTAELSHRVKNTITGIQAIVDQTLRSHGSTQQARSVVSGRLAALGRVHDLLSAADWHGATLREILDTVLQPYAGRIRYELNGEVLAPRAALGLALLLHELATNAVKYGSLSTPSGNVTIRLTRLPTVNPRIEIVWQERGGPAIEPNQREGFGTRLIRSIVAHDLRGECELVLKPAGVTCTISAPENEVLVSTGRCAHGAAH